MIKIVWSINDINKYQTGSLPDDAVKIETPQSVGELMKKAVPIAAILCVFLFIAMLCKTIICKTVVISPIFIPVGFAFGFLLLIIHEWLHGIVYPKEADVTIGYHCGYISPIPYIDQDEVPEEELRNYIEAISNDIVSWENIKERFEKDNGVTFADEKIADEKGKYEIGLEKGKKWVAGSTLCLNLNHLDKIPAFYNPPDARGEDTFFACMLDKATVVKVPVYHFHDGFLKYTQIMKQNYPKSLRKIKSSEDEIEQRFIRASRGWIRYKPLLMYIMDKKHYEEKMKETQEKLKKSIPEINKLFENSDFNVLLKELRSYDRNVEAHYAEYLKTNKIWNKIKHTLADLK